MGPSIPHKKLSLPCRLSSSGEVIQVKNQENGTEEVGLTQHPIAESPLIKIKKSSSSNNESEGKNQKEEGEVAKPLGPFPHEIWTKILQETIFSYTKQNCPDFLELRTQLGRLRQVNKYFSTFSPLLAKIQCLEAMLPILTEGAKALTAEFFAILKTEGILQLDITDPLFASNRKSKCVSALEMLTPDHSPSLFGLLDQKMRTDFVTVTNTISNNDSISKYTAWNRLLKAWPCLEEAEVGRLVDKTMQAVNIDDDSFSSKMDFNSLDFAMKISTLTAAVMAGPADPQRQDRLQKLFNVAQSIPDWYCKAQALDGLCQAIHLLPALQRNVNRSGFRGGYLV